jgi:hypothetical protein
MPDLMTLWRLTNITKIADPAALDQGLRAHLADASLWTGLVQVGTAQRAYLGVQGCSGCALGHCALGCRAGLIRRTLSAALGVEANSTLVRRGLDHADIRVAFWVWPAHPDAALLDGSLTAGWPRARLFLRWVPGSRRVGGMVTLGGDAAGPELTSRLRAARWRALAIPPHARRWIAEPLAWAATPLHARTHAPPSILLPSVTVTSPVTVACADFQRSNRSSDDDDTCLDGAPSCGSA